MTGSAVEDLEDQHWASAERVLPDRPDRRGVRIVREDHHVREARGAPEWLVEPQSHLLVAPEPESPDCRQPTWWQCGRKSQQIPLENTERHSHHHVRAFLGCAVTTSHTYATRRMDHLIHVYAQA